MHYPCENPDDNQEWREHQAIIMSELFPTLANREAALKYRHAEAFRKRKEGRIFPHDSIDIGTAVMVWDAEMHNKNLSISRSLYLVLRN